VIPAKDQGGEIGVVMEILKLGIEKHANRRYTKRCWENNNSLRLGVSV